MNRHNNLTTVLILIAFLGMIACTNNSGNKMQTEKNITQNSSEATQQTHSAPIDSLTIQKEKLTHIYTQAIAEFIKAAYKKDKTTFDTLYFGKHVFGQDDDFPDIELPTTIEKTQIRLIAPELGNKIQNERKSLVYVNMMGWVNNEKAEFILVIFTKGGKHQYDYFINFNFDVSANNYELNNIEFENYLQLNGQKPKRTSVYKAGKYAVDNYQ